MVNELAPLARDLAQHPRLALESLGCLHSVQMFQQRSHPVRGLLHDVCVPACLCLRRLCHRPQPVLHLTNTIHLPPPGGGETSYKSDPLAKQEQSINTGCPAVLEARHR
jgi:hypothetical protein